MKLEQSSGSLPRKQRGVAISLTFIAVLVYLIPARSQSPDPVKVSLADVPEAIYSPDPNDSWNRIFYFLFSRRMQVRLSDEFPEGAPFTKDVVDFKLLNRGISVSTRTFERSEIGDRPIDPFYPSSLDAAAERFVLADPIYPGFATALHDALNDSVPRSPTARALMQNDLWAAYDILSNPFMPADEKALGDRRRVIVDLLARLIRKIALTPNEIKFLPSNYSAAMRQHSLPDLFGKDKGWIEVEWFPGRNHDLIAGYRRASRIFVKPVHPPGDVGQFLAALPNHSDSPVADLDGVALVMQLLVIDTQGNLRPTALTTDVQVRLFEKTNERTFKATSLEVCELSRKLLVLDPKSGGMVAEKNSAPVYVGGYDFASSTFQFAPGKFQVGPPVQVRLRTRCSFCHGDDLKRLMTFSIVMPPHPPPFRQMNPTANDEAEFDIAQKKKQKDFEALREYFDRVPAGGTYH